MYFTTITWILCWLDARDKSPAHWQWSDVSFAISHPFKELEWSEWFEYSDLIILNISQSMYTSYSDYKSLETSPKWNYVNSFLLSDAMYDWYEFENHWFKITTPSPRGQWINAPLALPLPNVTSAHPSARPAWPGGVCSSSPCGNLTISVNMAALWPCNGCIATGLGLYCCNGKTTG